MSFLNLRFLDERGTTASDDSEEGLARSSATSVDALQLKTKLEEEIKKAQESLLVAQKAAQRANEAAAEVSEQLSCRVWVTVTDL